MNRQDDNSDLVYSTERGRILPARDKGGEESAARATPPKSDGIVRVSRETKGRKGKGVTIITGVPLDAAGVKELARQLKARCGAGGSVRDGVIEIQGDHRDALIEVLKKNGWTVKRAGG